MDMKTENPLFGALVDCCWFRNSALVHLQCVQLFIWVLFVAASFVLVLRVLNITKLSLVRAFLIISLYQSTATLPIEDSRVMSSCCLTKGTVVPN